jgi:hypothetical protein
VYLQTQEIGRGRRILTVEIGRMRRCLKDSTTSPPAHFNMQHVTYTILKEERERERKRERERERDTSLREAATCFDISLLEIAS